MSAGKYLVYGSLVSMIPVFLWGMLSDNRFIPYAPGLSSPSTWSAQLGWIHTALSLLLVALVVWSSVAVWRGKPRLTGAAEALLLALALLLVLMCLGGLVTSADYTVAVSTISLAIATTVLALILVAVDRVYLAAKTQAGIQI